MSSPSSRQLPTLAIHDFGHGQDDVVIAYQNGRIFAILHKNDPAHRHLPNVHLDTSDPYTYFFVHGGAELTRFENLRIGTHEIPDHVVAQLLVQALDSNLDQLQIRMCTCYGNMLRPGDLRSAVGRLAGLLPRTVFEAYHGLVHIDLTQLSPRIVLGDQLAWDPVSGPYRARSPSKIVSAHTVTQSS